MDRAAWRATIHGVAESDKTEQLSTPQTHTPKKAKGLIQWVEDSHKDMSIYA